MALEKITIFGLRGFSETQEILIAEPNNSYGSGLTILTGSNNSGKSTIIEAFRARSTNQHTKNSFPEKTRNFFTNQVLIGYFFSDRTEKVKSIQKGSSETTQENIKTDKYIYVLPSRKAFKPYFNKNTQDRQNYIRQKKFPANRSSTLNNFEHRLFNVLENPTQFNKILEKILGFTPEWTIDQSNQGQYFLKFFSNEASHTSDGLGDGFINLFAIADSLHDSNPGDIIVIDEPELSLHPSYQKRLIKVLSQFASDRQIIIATHSPYMIDLDAIINGGSITRVVKSKKTSLTFNLNNNSRKIIENLSKGNIYNPHILGLNAKELFFQDDGLIIVEGQEDVILYPKIIEQLNIDLAPNFFGWGAGGAGNIQHICSILKNIGFKNIIGLLDGNEKEKLTDLEERFSEFKFLCIPTDDIRDKPDKGVEGILDEEKNLKSKYKEELESILGGINSYLK